MKLTKEEFLAFRPCDAGLDFAKSHRFNFRTVWEVCPRGDWLLWLLARVAPLTKPQAVELANTFAAQAERYSARYAARYAADADAAADAAAYARYSAAAAAFAAAAYSAAAAANAAADSARYAVGAAYAAYAARREQANEVRKRVKNPFDS